MSMNREQDMLMRREILTWTVNCLKCGKEFESADKKRNRLCETCNNSIDNKRSGRIARVLFDYRHFE